MSRKTSKTIEEAMKAYCTPNGFYPKDIVQMMVDVLMRENYRQSIIISDITRHLACLTYDPRTRKLRYVRKGQGEYFTAEAIPLFKRDAKKILTQFQKQEENLK